MAVKRIETTGHEPVDDIDHTTSGTLTAGHIASIVYSDAASPAEVNAAVLLCIAKLQQVQPA